MKVLNQEPPNYQEIIAAFPAAESAEVVMTYGDCIYNPKSLRLREDVMFHESIHANQQGNDPVAWWKKYIEDPEFRISQELQAYGAQLAFLRKFRTGPAIAIALKNLAHFASSPVYGNAITMPEALKRIKKISRSY